MEEAREVALKEGRSLSIEIARELMLKVPVEEVAVKHNVTVDQVKQIQTVLFSS